MNGKNNKITVISTVQTGLQTGSYHMPAGRFSGGIVLGGDKNEIVMRDGNIHMLGGNLLPHAGFGAPFFGPGGPPSGPGGGRGPGGNDDPHDHDDHRRGGRQHPVTVAEQDGGQGPDSPGGGCTADSKHVAAPVLSVKRRITRKRPLPALPSCAPVLRKKRRFLIEDDDDASTLPLPGDSEESRRAGDDSEIEEQPDS